MARSYLLLTGLVLACGGSTEGTPPPFPPRQPGCEVQVFPAAPTYQTVSLGTVTASCEEHLSDEECLRVLKDQACKMGADTVWGVNDPTLANGKKKLSGRAVHQKQ